MFSFSDESNISIFFCFYIIIFIVTLNFWRILKGKGKIEELNDFPCVPVLVRFHFLGLLLPIVDLLIVGFLGLVFTNLSSHFIVYLPTVLSLFYHDTMCDWMAPLILIYAITLSTQIPNVFEFGVVKVSRDALIWMSMLIYGLMFNSLNPWDIITIRKIHHENGHISTSFNPIDVFIVVISIIFIGLHGYRMSFSVAFRDNKFHITILFVLIKMMFLLTSVCFIPAIPDHTPNSEKVDQIISLDNLKLYESVVLNAVPIHYLAWKHLFFKNI